MRYRVILDARAQRDIRRLPAEVQARTLRAAYALAENPRPPGCLKLHGRGDQYRIRVGNYRIIYEIEDDILVVVVVEVGPRDSVY